MKISCNSTPRDVCEVNLHLYSNDFNFLWQTIPPADENGVVTFTRDGRVRIDFRDTYEVDKFIEMLERFREESRKHMGWWDLV